MLLRAIVLALLAITAVNCGSNNNQNPVVSPFVGSGYSLGANGQCISTTTGQIAPSPTYCTNSLGAGYTGYSLGANGQCISTTTGQIAPSPAYCTGSAFGTTGIGTGIGIGIGTGIGAGYGTSMGGSGSVCYGPFMWNGQMGMCYGQPDNCAGYVLQSYPYGQTVYCP